MCWSIGASAVATTVGVGTAGYLIKKKESKLLWVPLLFFASMELLQVFQYFVINDCSSPTNQMLTLLGFYHIAFQPFFINSFALYFIPKTISDRIAPFVYTVCFAGTILLLVSVYPFEWIDKCVVGMDSLCGSNLCTVSGTWHLAWEIPANLLGRVSWMGNARLFTLFGYFIPAFLLPFLYGSWKFNIYHLLIGPILAASLTSNLNESAAIWCLLSIGYILVALIPRVKKSFKVKKWYFWNFPKNLS
jgi:Family of unknown function (DUF5765)